MSAVLLLLPAAGMRVRAAGIGDVSANSALIQGENVVVSVSMKNSVRRLGMKIIQRFQQLTRPTDQIRLGGFLPIIQDLVKALSFDVVHHGIDRVTFLDEVVHLRDIGIAEPLKKIHFSSERFAACPERPLVCL